MAVIGCQRTEMCELYNFLNFPICTSELLLLSAQVAGRIALLGSGYFNFTDEEVPFNGKVNLEKALAFPTSPQSQK